MSAATSANERSGTQQESLRILLVEDSPGDTRLLEEEMTDAGVTAFHVTYAGRLSQALRAHAPGAFDVVLLDLSLPDSKGLDTVRRAVEAMPDVPILVLTTLDDDALAVQAVAAGAQDYLIKGEAEGYQIVRAMRHAMARHRTSSGRAAAEHDADADGTGLGVAPASFGPPSLREALPDTFDELTRAYAELVSRTAAAVARGETVDVSRPLIALAERLGVLRGGPRDVLDMHAGALRATGHGSTPATLVALGESTRHLAFELMGHLAGFYRRYSLTRGDGARTAGDEGPTPAPVP